MTQPNNAASSSPVTPPRFAIARLPLLVVAILALMIGVWAGLLRIGVHVPELRTDLTAAHGPLMISGFLGTLITLERAIALAHVIQNKRLKQLPYLTPMLTLVGTLAVLAHVSDAAIFMVLGSLGYILMCGYMFYRRRTFDIFLMGLGALYWSAGNMAWLNGDPFHEIVLDWAPFLIFTIAAERLELSHIRKFSVISSMWFVATLPIFGVGAWWSESNLSNGIRLFAVGELLLAGWLLRYDIARRTIKKTGVTKFVAACLLSGYAWLGISGVFGLWFGGVMAGPRYDAILHALFLGFVMSMIFGHAPIIFPAILNTPLHFSQRFYAHLVLLHVSLVIRIVGDVLPDVTLRRWGGALNAVVLAIFLFNTVRSVREASVSRRLSLNERLAYLIPLPALLIGMALVVYGFLGKTTPENTDSADSPAFIAALDDPTIQRGADAYLIFCSACHGPDARGLPGLGKDLVASEFARGLRDEALRDFIIQGRPAWDAANTTGIEMPARGGHPLLSDSEIEAIVVYLRSLQQVASD